MSDSQTAWTILWTHAASLSPPGAPFEISDVTPEVAGTLKISQDDASRLIGRLLSELDRLPDGKRYFRSEGNAVVPLPAFFHALDRAPNPLDVYPYEL